MATSPEQDEYLVGAGCYDITGPCAELAMMGYGNSKQVATGIAQRLRARTFVIAHRSAPKQRVCIVTCDLWSCTQAVKVEVCKQLGKIYGGMYNEANVMISATHTHAGLGGFSWHAFYNITSWGFIPQNFNSIVQGIVHSIGLAHGNIVPGWLRWSENEARNCGYNRSPAAYACNKDRREYRDDVDSTMTVLQILSGSSLLGIIAWHGVHCTCLDRDNTFVSGDCKGVASYLFEKVMGVDYESAEHFVAAFPQGACGDVSPLNGERGDGRLLSISNGWSQFRAAHAACRHGAVLHGRVEHRYTYVDFQGKFVESAQITLPTAAIGHSMAEGAIDGRTPSLELFALSSAVKVIRPFAESQQISAELATAHFPKDILWFMGDGRASSATWVPHVLPLQIISIGSFSIVGIPFEATTMVSRRLCDSLQEVLGSRVICAGLTNAYAGYCTTFEEYQKQEYEGGHTIFGPHQYDALQQELTKLVRSPPGFTGSLRPPDLSTVMQVNLQTGVVLDAPIIGYRIGDCIREAPSSVNPGTLVEVEFCAGHPKNDLYTQRTYLVVERKDTSGWVVVANDSDLETEFEWRRIGIAASKVIIRWWVPLNARGLYRIRHFGAYRALSRAVAPYTGISKDFVVESRLLNNKGHSSYSKEFADLHMLGPQLEDFKMRSYL